MSTLGLLPVWHGPDAIHARKIISCSGTLHSQRPSLHRRSFPAAQPSRALLWESRGVTSVTQLSCCSQVSTSRSGVNRVYIYCSISQSCLSCQYSLVHLATSFHSAIPGIVRRCLDEGTNIMNPYTYMATSIYVTTHVLETIHHCTNNTYFCAN